MKKLHEVDIDLPSVVLKVLTNTSSSKNNLLFIPALHVDLDFYEAFLGDIVELYPDHKVTAMKIPGMRCESISTLTAAGLAVVLLELIGLF